MSVNIICEETLRKSFVSHLSGALRRTGISVSVFSDKDSKELEACPLPDNPNQGARVSVVVFSKSNAFSIFWIVKVLERQKNNLHVVVPVFYDVHPSAVNRNLEWLKTLMETGNLTNHHSTNSSDTDSDLVAEIVENVYRKLFPTERIGINSRLLDLVKLHCKQPWGIIRTLGIWGMPGIGKTTLAKAFFEYISDNYDASCFIKNFDETIHKEGVERLLEGNFGNIMKEKLDAKILVVLDDVCDPLVAESFLTKLHWFGLGSLIIISSRNKLVFSFCKFSHVYEVQRLDKQEALQLFSQIAFGKDVPEGNDKEMSMKVIDYTNGNPLVLRFYGQELKKMKSEMETAFLELIKFPVQKIRDTLG